MHIYECSFCGFFHAGHGSEPYDAPRSMERLTMTDLKKILKDVRSRLQPGLSDKDRVYWHGRVHAVEDRIEELKAETDDDALAPV